MKYRIVLDSNIWIDGILDEYFLAECNELLELFIANNRFRLSLDDNDELVSEYRHMLGGNREFEIRMRELENNERIDWITPFDDSAYKMELVRRGFHEAEDIKFVNVAMASDRVIVSEDSDYGVHGEEDKKEVYDYMTGKMLLELYNSKQFVDVLKGDIYAT